MGGDSVQRRQDQHWQAQGGMTFWPLLLCTICYAWTSAGFAMQQNYAMSAVFAGYFAANLAFLWMAWHS